jgi:pimeloyl-ACP methyl ester carboxylesterase
MTKNQHMITTRRISWAALGMAITTGIVLGGSAVASPGPAVGGTDPGNRPGSGLDRFDDQPITWHACRTGPDDDTGAQLDAVGARCGEITVPLDYRDPGGRTITVAVARRAATDQAHKLGTLIVNLGGPDASRNGVSALAQGIPDVAPNGAPDLAARYDLVGIDPRFFGLSTPLDCRWPTNLALGMAQVATPDKPGFDASVATARDLAARCAAQADLLPFASTRDIARDMDVVRAAMDVPRISYLAWSYGAYLGAVYLQMFPDRVDRIVLDSSPDPTTYGPDLNQNLGPANTAALADWAGWAAQRNSQYGLGGTADDVLATVNQFTAAARQHPLRDGSFTITADMIPGLLLPVVDTDAGYGALAARAQVMHEAADGQPITADPDLDQFLALYVDTDVVPELHFSATTANQCADRATSRDPRTYYQNIQDHLATEPFYGALFHKITPCAFWPTNPIEAPTTIDNDHPALMVGATGDPAAAYSGQLVMHAALHGSRMVTLAGAFRHAVYLAAGNTCVDTTVQNYLLTGALPGSDLTCTR